MEEEGRAAKAPGGGAEHGAESITANGLASILPILIPPQIFSDLPPGKSDLLGLH